LYEKNRDLFEQRSQLMEEESAEKEFNL